MRTSFPDSRTANGLPRSSRKGIDVFHVTASILHRADRSRTILSLLPYTVKSARERDRPMLLVDNLGLGGDDPQVESSPAFEELRHAGLVNAMTMPG